MYAAKEALVGMRWRNAFALDIVKSFRLGLCGKVGKKEFQVSINEADQSACPGNGQERINVD